MFDIEGLFTNGQGALVFALPSIPYIDLATKKLAVSTYATVSFMPTYFNDPLENLLLRIGLQCETRAFHASCLDDYGIEARPSMLIHHSDTMRILGDFITT